MVTERLEGENLFEHKLRLCKAKLNHELDLDWQEIVELLGLNMSADHLRKTAYGMIEYDEYIHGFGGVTTTILSVSDLHVPFAKPLETFRDYAGKIDVLQLNGDILDCMQLSRFNKSYRTSPVDEIIEGRQYIIDLIEMIRPKKVLVNHGNHELRLGQYLAKNLDNELQELMPETAFDYIFVDGFTHYDRKTRAKVKYAPLCEVFEDIEIEYTGTWYSQYKDVLFCHPKAFASSPLRTAEKALYWFRNESFDFKTLVMSHTHRVGSYKIGNSMIYEQGCCCDTNKMKYNDGQLINSQKEGFMIICLDEDGHLINEKTKIITLN
jgi:predicted phosphodiesterase